jgi:hypothetical protein
MILDAPATFDASIFERSRASSDVSIFEEMQVSLDDTMGSASRHAIIPGMHPSHPSPFKPTRATSQLPTPCLLEGLQ